MCGNCRFVRADDKFFGLNPARVYNKNYYVKGQYSDYENEKGPLLENFEDRLDLIIKYQKGGALLDVGCAYGYFLLAARKYFKPTGIDIDRDTVRKAGEISGVPTFAGDFLTKKIPGKKFDVITFFDSIEHLKSPKAALLKAKSLLRKGGIVAIETGDIGSILSQIQKDKWRMIEPGIHLSYFSKKTLTGLLESIGFTILNTSHVPFKRSVGQILHRLSSGRLTLPFLSNLSLKLNTYDIMFTIARKK